MNVIYVGNRPFKTAVEAAQEVSRLSGEDAGVWQISRALLWNKGFVNGVPVFAKETPVAAAGMAAAEAAAAEAAGAASFGEETEPGRPPGRAPLLRIREAYAGGIPPRWR
jgi:hypothetical protein